MVDEWGENPVGKVREGNLGGEGGIDHVDDRLKGEEDPEPPPVGVCLAPIGRPLRVSVHIVAPLVDSGERGGAASFHDLVVERGEEVRDGRETGGDRAGGQRDSPIFQILDELGRRTIVGELVDQNGSPDRDPELALGHEAGAGGAIMVLGVSAHAHVFRNRGRRLMRRWARTVISRISASSQDPQGAKGAWQEGQARRGGS